MSTKKTPTKQASGKTGKTKQSRPTEAVAVTQPPDNAAQPTSVGAEPLLKMRMGEELFYELIKHFDQEQIINPAAIEFSMNPSDIRNFLINKCKVANPGLATQELFLNFTQQLEKLRKS